MPDYTLTLTAAEDLALARWLERLNAQRATERDEQDQPLAPFTAEQLLHWTIRNDLQNIREELQRDTLELATILRALTPAQRTAVLATLPAGARKNWLVARVQQGG
jgi:hypothetical protein